MAPALSLSIVALARDEAQHLERCLQSLRPITNQTNSEIIVILDSRATEETEGIARSLASRLVVKEFTNFAAQRNAGLREAKGGWVFFIDADERCTRPLADEVVRSTRSTTCVAFRVARRNILFGREVKHAGWYPDYQIRLLRRSLCSYNETKAVHEVPEVDGAICTLQEPLIHYNYSSWRQFLAKQREYSRLEAETLWHQGMHVRPRALIGQPAREFLRRYVEYEGYKDGLLGLALSLAMSLYRGETYRKLLYRQWREQR